ncbi:hypothetical protein KCP76_04695 [Salmonella enterica subsp. enterica serovar Weltevreden]|nr:hypothetical protein KCP76_04695 [Salmonella enterica subsp. enterica serovar Weltevreden]
MRREAADKQSRWKRPIKKHTIVPVRWWRRAGRHSGSPPAAGIDGSSGRVACGGNCAKAPPTRVADTDESGR